MAGRLKNGSPVNRAKNMDVNSELVEEKLPFKPVKGSKKGKSKKSKKVD